MSNDKEKDLDVVSKELRYKHDQVYMLDHGEIPGKIFKSGWIAATDAGIFVYKLNDPDSSNDFKYVELVDYTLWEDITEATIDYYLLKAHLKLNDKTYVINGDAKGFAQMVHDKTGVTVTKLERSVSRKFFGFRSNKLWKKIAVISTYLLAAILFIGLFFGGSDDTDNPTRDVAESSEQTNDTQSSTFNDDFADDVTSDTSDNTSSGDPQDKPNASDEKESQEETKATPSGENTDKATVTRVVDGDTIEVDMNGQEEQIRLLLVDTPETKHPSKPVQKFGPEASAFAKKTLEGQKITLEYDGPERDKYGRLLGYIWVGGEMFNEMLLEEGYARYAYVYDPPYTHSTDYKEAEQEARSEGLRIWSIENYVTEDGFSAEGNTVASSSGNTSGTTGANAGAAAGAGAGAATGSAPAGDLPYDPAGPDRNCGDFNSQEVAQKFFEAAGGPAQDPHELDGNDQDGIVCESL